MTLTGLRAATDHDGEFCRCAPPETHDRLVLTCADMVDRLDPGALTACCSVVTPTAGPGRRTAVLQGALMTPDHDPSRRPLSRSAVVLSVVIVVLVVVAGVVAAVALSRGAGTDAGPEETQAEPAPSRDDDGESITGTDSPAEPAEDGAVAAEETSAPEARSTGTTSSTCGIGVDRLDGTLSDPPDTVWQYQGESGYPTSTVHGPGTTSPEGVRTCFERSPEGAVFMAANAAVQGSSASTAIPWLPYAVSEGRYRERFIEEVDAPDSYEEESSSRLTPLGFRVLAYDGDSARVDVAMRLQTGTDTFTVSGIYALVWQDGDWKLDAEVEEPMTVTPLPDAVGYVAWNE